MYAEACRSLGYEPVGLEIRDLQVDGHGRIEVQDAPDEQAAFRNRLEDWVSGIRAGRFDPCTDRRVCARCDFCTFCRYAPAEYRSGSRPGDESP